MFEILNPVGIFVAAIVGYVIGMAWYSPILFMKPWLEGQGKTPEDFSKPQKHKTKKYMFSLMVYTFMVTTTIAFVLAVFITLTGALTLLEILQISILLAFGFIVTTKFSDMLYTVDKPFWSMQAQKLFFVNAGYYIAMFLAMGSTLYYLG
ncbi:MAG: DUF1761 domain-containing protein [bacterium]|nr:DUF1761 domain-containing protein [bacterium]